MKTLCVFMICLSLLYLSCKPAAQQSNTEAIRPTVISDIIVAGNRRIPTETIKSQIHLKPGEALNESVIRDDVARIRALGEFNDVRVSDEAASDGRRVLVFQVSEKLQK